MPARPALSGLSFRWQITLLGAMVVVLFAGTFMTALNALGSTRSAVLSEGKKSVAETAQRLAQAYADEFGTRPQQPGTPAEPSGEVLERLSQGVLEETDGMVGGYYWAQGDRLASYAYPAYEGVTEGEDVSFTVKPAVLEAAQQAVRSGQPAERVFTGLADIVLLHAVPIRVGTQTTGSAWAMKRLSGLPGSNRLRAYLEAFGLGLAALLSLVMTLLVVRNLQRGVRKIEGGLAHMEGNLSSRIAAKDDPEEIQRIANAINRMGENLKKGIENEKQIENRMRHSERLAALGRLVAAVAHEVRNPLATIRLRVQMCEQDAKSPAVQESCAVALEEIERLNGMVNRLLSFAQPVKLQPGPTELGRLVEQRVAGFQEKARHQGVSVVTRFHEGAGTANVDPSRMAQVFDNVIQNAIEAMTESGGTLSINVEPVRAAGGAREVCVEFTDTGKGMSSETASRIFDPFFTTKATGTGLGLSICHELVRAHGGDIQVASTERVGTRVRILLPAGDGAAANA
jgi:signal transduction histidine kinase